MQSVPELLALLVVARFFARGSYRFYAVSHVSNPQTLQFPLSAIFENGCAGQNGWLEIHLWLALAGLAQALASLRTSDEQMNLL